MSSNFDFVTDDRLRISLENDYAELEKCISNECWKAALVLSGSIVESVLVDALITIEYQKKGGQDPLNMTLAKAIDVMRQEGVIIQRTAELASVVRDYRNVIHPGRQLRVKEEPDRDTSMVAKSLVDMILREVSTKQQANKGLTAEQLLSKLSVDPGAAKLIKHHIRSMSKSEIEKFLFSSAERKFFELKESETHIKDEDEQFELLIRRSAIAQAYRLALEQEDPKTQQKSAERFIAVLRDGTESYIRTYAENFLRPQDLINLNEHDRNFAKDYLLGLMHGNVSARLFSLVKDLRYVIERDDISRFIDPLVRTLTSDKVTTQIKAEIDHYLRDEISVYGQPNHEFVTERLQHWLPRFSDSDTRQNLTSIINYREIPF